MKPGTTEHNGTTGAPAATEPATSAERAPQRAVIDQVYSVAAEEDLLYSLKADGSRSWIDPVLTTGRYWRLRRVIGYSLVALFVGLPHLSIAGKPAILLDLAQRQFTLFGATLHPTDNLLLLAFGAFAIVFVFAVTALFGRLWCGYACPQPVYLELVYRPIERLVEGKPTAKRRRDQGPWTLDKAWRKALKWAVFALTSLLFCASFVAYFTGWGQLWSSLFGATPDHRTALWAWLAISGAMFFDFAYFRDQMCTVACPYGRLQTVLYDRDTIIVGYDRARGEPREARRKGKDPASLGDCIDCGRCVRTCPTGMDIRRGLQMECIGCAQCVEACDEVMDKQKKPRGLIRYTSLRELETGQRRFARPRVYIYAVLIAVTLGSLLVLGAGRRLADVEILRNGREPFRELPTGEIANMVRLRLTNNMHKPQAFTVELVAPATATLIVAQNPYTVAADRVATVEAVAKLPDNVFRRGRVSGRFIITSDAGVRIEEEFVLLGPYR